MYAPKKVIAADKATLEIVDVYNSVADCARANKVNDRTLASILARKSVPRGKLLFRYLEDFSPVETYAGKHNRPIKVTDFDTGKSWCLYDAETLAKLLLTTNKYVTECATKGCKILGRYAIQYYR